MLVVTRMVVNSRTIAVSTLAMVLMPTMTMADGN